MKVKCLFIIYLRKKILANAFLILSLSLGILFVNSLGQMVTSPKKVLKGITVVIDPGHGGIDGGVGEFLLEKDVNLETGILLKKYLEAKGSTVIMTRETDQELSHIIPNGPDTRNRRDVHGRGKIINESGGDLFISLHVNSCEDPSVRGAITFYSINNQESEALAGIIQSRLNTVTGENPGEGEYFHRNPKEGNYYLLNHTKIPGVIIEVGFMSSPGDRELLATPGYRKKIARAIGEGIVLFITSTPDRGIPVEF